MLHLPPGLTGQADTLPSAPVLFTAASACRVCVWAHPDDPSQWLDAATDAAQVAEFSQLTPKQLVTKLYEGSELSVCLVCPVSSSEAVSLWSAFGLYPHRRLRVCAGVFARPCVC